MQRLVEERMKKLSLYDELQGPFAAKISDVKTGLWRKQKPIIDHGVCNKCKICINYCPCGVMALHDYVHIDYAYCKGCGICAEECPQKAIGLIAEEKLVKGDLVDG